MFYLITEKDGLLSNDAILVNAKYIQLLETAMDKGASKINVRFLFSANNIHEFAFTKDEAFNVNQVIDNMIQLENVRYQNNLIALTDRQNVNNLHSQQFYLHKFSKMMVNLNLIQIAYMNQKGTFVSVDGKLITVSESVQDIYNMIQEKIIL